MTNLANVVGALADPESERTRAHDKIEQFYHSTGFTPTQVRNKQTGEAIGINLVYKRKQSIVEQIADAKSVFQIEMVLRDAWMFAVRADQKTKDRWVSAAEAREKELKGWL